MNFVRLPKNGRSRDARHRTFRFAAGEMQHPHGTNLESGLLDALNDPARVARRHCIRLDDRECSFHIVDYMQRGARC